MFKLGLYAERNWRKLRGSNYLARVKTGAKLADGGEVESDDQVAASFNYLSTRFDNLSLN